jgi:tetratricopeptide (TPR) repeat protein
VAAANSVAIAPTTYRLARGVFEYRDLGERRLKGLPKPARLRQVLRARVLDTRFEAYRAPKLAPLVGRAGQVALLAGLWQHVTSGAGQIVLISGEAGIGKSRLAQEFCDAARGDDAEVVHFQCLPLHAATALYPVSQYWWTTAELSSRDSPEIQADKVTQLLRRIGIETEPAAALMCSLLQIRASNIALPELSPQQFRETLVELLWAVLRRMSERGALVVVVEDAQWIDPTTEELLLRAFAELRRLPICIVATRRGEFPESWRRRRYATTVALERLSPEDSHSLVRSVGGRGLKSELVKPIVARGEGVPLFLEELTQAVRERRVSSRAHWSKAGIPATLHALLTERLDGLGEAKHLAQVAAVLGRQFSAKALAAVSGHSEEDVEEAVGQLLASGLVQRVGRGAGGLAFKHALVHDAAYESLLNSDKRRWHRKALRYLEERQKHSTARVAEAFAYHAERGEVWMKAVQYLAAACARATAKSANLEAIALFDRGLAALAHLPPDQAATHAIDLRRQVYPALSAMGDTERLMTVLREADELAQRIGDRGRQAAVQSQLAVGLWLAGQHRKGLEYAERAAALAAETGDFAIMLRARLARAHLHHALGMVREAADMYAAILRLLTGDLAYKRFDSPVLPSVLAHGFLAWCAIELGDFALARSTIDAAQHIIKDVSHPFSVVWVYLARGLYHLARRETRDAISAFETAQTLNERSEMRLPNATAWLAAAYVQDGRAHEALKLLSKADRAATYKSGGKYNWFHHHLSMAIVHLALGHVAAARAAVGEAQQIAETAEELLHLGWALKVRGDVETAGGAGETAARAYADALAIAEPRGLKVLQAHCHAGIARLHARAGRTGEASAHRRRAAAMFSALGLACQLVELELDCSGQPGAVA